MKNLVYYIVLLVLSAGCKQRYTPPVTSPGAGYLVVEGFINNGPEPTTIKLTRTTKIVDTASVVYEHNARVIIEGDDGESYPLPESGAGIYTTASLPALGRANKYRLHISTANGSEYMSDYSPVKTTPPIDSISWQRDENGVRLFINTHDPLNNTRYYQWEYEETWEFHSAFNSSLIYVITPLPDANTFYSVGNRLPDGTVDTTIYKCWHSPHSTSILLGSSEKLTTDRIFYPLLTIAPEAQQLSILYSIIVKQHAVSKGNYDFLQRMKKNTEQLGTIFDPQPSELNGNIHCVSNPAEQVVGYVEVSQLQAQRIFISNKDVPGWNYRQPCIETKISLISDSIKAYGTGLIPTSLGNIGFYNAAVPNCVDCTLTGSNIRPDFWP